MFEHFWPRTARDYKKEQGYGKEYGNNSILTAIQIHINSSLK